MKRDMELVRSILVTVGDADGPVPLDDLTTDDWGYQLVGYHVAMLQAHGLVDARVSHDQKGAVCNGEVHALTWDGADYLDAVRSDKVWRKAKKHTSDVVGTTTLGVIKSTCEHVALSMLTGAGL